MSDEWLRLGLLVGMLACSNEGHSESPPVRPASPAPPAVEITEAQPALPTVSIEVGEVIVQAEVADEPKERERGLMFRQAMGPDQGMLFVYPSERPRSFWMKNTVLPLSIAYLDARGRVVSIRDMEPQSTAPVPSGQRAMYALEMNQGWFDAHGVKVGDRVEGLPAPSKE